MAKRTPDRRESGGRQARAFGNRRPPAKPPQPDEQAAAAAFDRLPSLLREAGIAADEEALRVMRAHYELLLRWNARVNLTAVREPREIIERHFLESAYLLKALPLGSGLLYDVGSGAGFPGLPAKALCREAKLVMVESNQKKAAFLKEAIREAKLEGARVESVRVENLLERPEVELADWITMRAVGELEEMLRIFRHLLVPHGYVALFVGAEDAERIASNEAAYLWRDPLEIPGTERRMILVGQNLSGA